uniref:Uncharacterized protein n=1 Tax=Rhizophora mucronata TaxID=61149 RepID=A0A2P2QPJ7_RHIMU
MRSHTHTLVYCIYMYYVRHIL